MNLYKGEDKPLPGSMNATDWVDFLAENFTPKDLDRETLNSFLPYMKDLGLLVHCENDTLRWQDLKEGLDLKEQMQIMRAGFIKMASTELGFAIPFFIELDNIQLPTFESLIGSEKKIIEKKGILKPERTSDLSNLQIVKKVGRQLKPYLEAEKILVNKLLGKNTTKTDARNLFQYMFGKINSKAQPRKWEQLSRKRHR